MIIFKKALKIYGGIVTLLLIAAAAYFVIVGAIAAVAGKETNNISGAAGTFVGVVFLIIGIPLAIYAIVFTVIYALRLKGKTTRIMDVIMFIFNVLAIVIIIVTAVKEGNLQMLSILAPTAIVVIYNVLCIVDNEKSKKTNEEIKEFTENVN